MDVYCLSSIVIKNNEDIENRIIMAPSDIGIIFSVHIYSSVVACTLGTNNDRKLNGT